VANNYPQKNESATVNPQRIVVEYLYARICENNYEDKLRMTPTKKLALHGAGLVNLERNR